jgi:hypothetical protein
LAELLVLLELLELLLDDEPGMLEHAASASEDATTSATGMV